MYYPAPRHGECQHYSNGKCTLYNVPVDPNAPACPNFKPKTIRQPATTPPSIQPQYWTPPSQPPTAMPPGMQPYYQPPMWGRRVRRRWRRGRRGFQW